jgi:hypothetical protein
MASTIGMPMVPGTQHFAEVRLCQQNHVGLRSQERK